MPRLQKRITILKMRKIPVEKIKKILNISQSDYENAVERIKRNENMEMFLKDTKYNMEEYDMKDRVIAISESEDYRMDKLPMFTLLQQKKMVTLTVNTFYRENHFSGQKKKRIVISVEY